MPSGGSSQQHAVVDEVLHTLYDGLHSQTAALGLFKKMDLNGTGELRARDLRVSLQRKFGLKLDATRVELVMARLDGDRDGTISVDDFLRGYYRARLGFVRRHFRARSYSGGRAHWVKLFQKYDRDHSGAIDIYEFRRAVRRDAKLSATTVSDDELQGLFNFIDVGKTGTVTVEEFIALLDDESLSKFRKRGDHAGDTPEVEWVLQQIAQELDRTKSTATQLFRHFLNSFDVRPPEHANPQLSAAEFKQVLKQRLNLDLGDDISELVAAFDTAGDGKVSVKDFIARVRRVQRERPRHQFKDTTVRTLSARSASQMQANLSVEDYIARLQLQGEEERKSAQDTAVRTLSASQEKGFAEARARRAQQVERLRRILLSQEHAARDSASLPAAAVAALQPLSESADKLRDWKWTREHEEGSELTQVWPRATDPRVDLGDGEYQTRTATAPLDDTSPQRSHSASELFEQLDVNGDGVISKGEFLSGLLDPSSPVNYSVVSSILAMSGQAVPARSPVRLGSARHHHTEQQATTDHKLRDEPIRAKHRLHMVQTGQTTVEMQHLAQVHLGPSNVTAAASVQPRSPVAYAASEDHFQLAVEKQPADTRAPQRICSTASQLDNDPPAAVGDSTITETTRSSVHSADPRPYAASHHQHDTSVVGTAVQDSDSLWCKKPPAPTASTPISEAESTPAVKADPSPADEDDIVAAKIQRLKETKSESTPKRRVEEQAQQQVQVHPADQLLQANTRTTAATRDAALLRGNSASISELEPEPELGSVRSWPIVSEPELELASAKLQQDREQPDEKPPVAAPNASAAAPTAPLLDVPAVGITGWDISRDGRIDLLDSTGDGRIDRISVPLAAEKLRLQPASVGFSGYGATEQPKHRLHGDSLRPAFITFSENNAVEHTGQQLHAHHSQLQPASVSFSQQRQLGSQDNTAIAGTADNDPKMMQKIAKVQALARGWLVRHHLALEETMLTELLAEIEGQEVAEAVASPVPPRDHTKTERDSSTSAMLPRATDPRVDLGDGEYQTRTATAPLDDTSPQRSHSASELFEQLDVNGDGVISKGEFLSGLLDPSSPVNYSVVSSILAMSGQAVPARSPPPPPSPAPARPSPKLIAGRAQLLSGPDRNLRALFGRIDTNHSGQVDRNEVGEMARILGHPMTETELDTAMLRMDPDGDGWVSFEEFALWMKKRKSAELFPNAELFPRNASSADSDVPADFGQLCQRYLPGGSTPPSLALRKPAHSTRLRLAMQLSSLGSSHHEHSNGVEEGVPPPEPGPEPEPEPEPASAQHQDGWGNTYGASVSVADVVKLKHSLESVKRREAASSRLRATRSWSHEVLPQSPQPQERSPAPSQVYQANIPSVAGSLDWSVLDAPASVASLGFAALLGARRRGS